MSRRATASQPRKYCSQKLNCGTCEWASPHALGSAIATGGDSAACPRSHPPALRPPPRHSTGGFCMTQRVVADLRDDRFGLSVFNRTLPILRR